MAILGISEDEIDDDDSCKKAYRARMLQYHPDKNKSAEAAERFREIREAYEFLQNEFTEDVTESYDAALKSFLSKVIEEEYAELAAPLVKTLFSIVFNRLIQYVESNSDRLLDYLRKINRPTLHVLYSMLSKYRHSFHLPEEFVKKMGEVLTVEEYIVLNPTLEDMLSEENIYKLKYKDQTYLVPLWHHEMTFECEGRDLVVRCFPFLPDNIELDECNVLTVYLELSVTEVWNQFVRIVIGGRPFIFDGRLLRLTEDPQQIIMEQCGVIYNNTRDIFDATTKQNVIFIIRLKFDIV